MVNTIFENGNKGHYEVEFVDGLCGVGFYDKSLDSVVRSLANIDREVSEIRFVEDNSVSKENKLNCNEYGETMLDLFERTLNNCKYYEEKGNKASLLNEIGVLRGIAYCLETEGICIHNNMDFRSLMDSQVELKVTLN